MPTLTMPPAPDAGSLEHSRRLVDRIRAALEAAGGWLDFAEYMRLALYAPGLGYYSAGAAKFGGAGDFVTAPELGPAFGRCLARAMAPALRTLGEARLVELGAGTGALAATLLETLAAEGVRVVDYRILEVSAELRERQAQTLARRVPEHQQRVHWLDAPPAEPFAGVVLANEVLDALPVRCFAWAGGDVQALGVSWRDDGLAWTARPADAGLRDAVLALRDAAGPDGWPKAYRSEYCPQLPGWLASVTRSLARGLCLITDYGLPRHEYYHPQRSGGTLVCHYRHRAHDDPFLYPGLQDISAWVDFTAVAEAAVDAGLAVDGFATQAQFLLANGLATEAATAGAGADAAAAAAALRRLVLPGEMGENFKLMVLRRDLPPGQVQLGRDLTHRL